MKVKDRITMSKAMDIRHRRLKAKSATLRWEAKAAVDLGKIATTTTNASRLLCKWSSRSQSGDKPFVWVALSAVQYAWTRSSRRYKSVAAWLRMITGQRETLSGAHEEAMCTQLAWKGFSNVGTPVYQAESNAKRQLIDCQVLRQSGPRPWCGDRTPWLAGLGFPAGRHRKGPSRVVQTCIIKSSWPRGEGGSLPQSTTKSPFTFIGNCLVCPPWRTPPLTLALMLTPRRVSTRSSIRT